jgi:hypothetical protein
LHPSAYRFRKDAAADIAQIKRRSVFTLGTYYYRVHFEFDGGSLVRRTDWMRVLKLSALTVTFQFVESECATAPAPTASAADGGQDYERVRPKEPVQPTQLTHQSTGRAVSKAWCRRLAYESQKNVSAVCLPATGSAMWQIDKKRQQGQ